MLSSKREYCFYLESYPESRDPSIFVVDGSGRVTNLICRPPRLSGFVLSSTTTDESVQLKRWKPITQTSLSNETGTESKSEPEFSCSGLTICMCEVSIKCLLNMRRERKPLWETAWYSSHFLRPRTFWSAPGFRLSNYQTIRHFNYALDRNALEKLGNAQLRQSWISLK